MRLEVGDIVLGRPGARKGDGWKDRLTSLLGYAVVRFEALFGDPAEFSHVAIVSKDGDTVEDRPRQPYVTEALARVETEPWEVNWKGRSFAIYRRLNLTAEFPKARAEIEHLASVYTGRPYGWWKLLLIGGDAWLSKLRGRDTRVFSRFLHRDGEPICSYLVQKFAHASWNETFGVPMGTAQPDDIGDWCDGKTWTDRTYRLVYDTNSCPENFQRFILPEGGKTSTFGH